MCCNNSVFGYYTNLNYTNVTVIAITEHGCVAETPFSESIIVDDCTAEIGDVIPATFSISEHQKHPYFRKPCNKQSLVF